jgi:ABC-2 type transport system ATP-binding protein
LGAYAVIWSISRSATRSRTPSHPTCCSREVATHHPVPSRSLAAIAHDPELIILDEPFSGLDPVNQQVMEEIIHDLARKGRTVVFSTHVMQHAERLCERILLVARGKKIFDGTIGDAKRMAPRRVLIESESEIAPLRDLAIVQSIEPSASGNGAATDPAIRRWEIKLREDADPQVILQTCFAQGIRLRRFDQTEPTLHDVFVQLVGPEAKEASFR